MGAFHDQGPRCGQGGKGTGGTDAAEGGGQPDACIVALIK